MPARAVAQGLVLTVQAASTLVDAKSHKTPGIGTCRKIILSFLMGFTGLARWINAPATGLELIHRNITQNHHGMYRGKWQVSLRSYRSTLGATSGFQIPERAMFVLAMDDNVFVLLEDPAAPTRTDLLQQVSDAPSDSFSPSLTTPSHYRNTFMTLSPPGSFEQLLSQLRARWISTRQSGASSRGQKGQGTGQQLLIEGQVFSIGSDWLVRAGNVILAGSAKGMLIEAEYLPLPVLHTQSADGTSELVSNLLTSVLPIIPDAKTVAINVSDPMWDEVLWNAEDEESAQIEKNKQENDADDIYVSADDPLVIRKGDWIGVDRDRRSAFLIIGALRQEGLV